MLLGRIRFGAAITSSVSSGQISSVAVAWGPNDQTHRAGRSRRTALRYAGGVNARPAARPYRNARSPLGFEGLRPCSNGTPRDDGPQFAASIRRASSASAARSGSTTKKTPRAPGRPASSSGIRRRPAPSRLTTAQDAAPGSPRPPGRRPHRLRRSTSSKPGDRCPTNSSAPSSPTRSSRPPPRSRGMTRAPALRAS